jgi:hypothetical protein
LNVTPEAILERAFDMAKMVPSVLAHLLEDQHDAITMSGSNFNAIGSSTGISDPTPRLAGAESERLAGVLAPFTAHERKIGKRLASIAKEFDDLERECQAAIKGQAPADTTPRCPGWNAELQARLGGCGEHLETYRLASGAHQVRSSGLCMKCRKASEREARMRENAA